MPDEFRSLKDVFNHEPELKNIREIIKDKDIVNDFFDIFPDLIKVVSSVKSNRKTLIIKVENPIWRQELKNQENNIVKKINEFYKEERISTIRFSY
jgi:hypothetical protein